MLDELPKSHPRSESVFHYVAHRLGFAAITERRGNVATLVRTLTVLSHVYYDPLAAGQVHSK